jgi:uncharacterized membrane protein YhaH (DUF805 family)
MQGAGPEIAPMLGGMQMSNSALNAPSPLKKFGASWKWCFFGCACAVLLASSIGFMNFLSCSPFDMICLIYQTFFGLMLFVMDAPIQVSRLEDAKLVIYKYMLFLTRFTGRGIAYIFLGCMVCSLLWDNGISPFLGFVLGGAIVGIGAIAVWFGYLHTKKLEMVRKALLNRGGPTQSVCPPQGLKTDKFRELAMKIQGVQFTEEELMYVANAMSLSIHGDDVISQREFETWLKDPAALVL